MKQKLLLTLIALFSIMGGAKAAITTADLIASTNGNEHPFFVVGTSNGYYWNSTTSPTATLAKRAQFAFYETSTSGVYKIKNITNNNWLSYTSAGSYSNTTGFVSFVTEESSAGLFKFEKVNNKDASTPCYQIRPLKSDASVADIYLNWLNGPKTTSNPLDGTVSVGVYVTAATDDAGSGWSLISTTELATSEQIQNAKNLIGTGVGYPKTTSAAYIALNGLTYGVTVADVEVAKSNYIACTDINLPVSGKAYKLNFVVNNDAHTKYYIKYNGTDAAATTTNAAEATPILFTEVNSSNHRYIMTLENGNLLTWMGGQHGYMIGSTRTGYSTMVAIQNDLDDWNLCWFANQGTTEAQLGTIRMNGRRTIPGNPNTEFSCWVIGSNGAWNQANESSFFGSNGATSALQFEEVAGITSETAGYKDGVEKYTLYTTAKKYDPYVGAGLGKYTYNTNQTSGLLDAVKACTTLSAERDIVNSIAFTLPQPGSFLRIKASTTNKNAYSGVTANQQIYLTSENSTQNTNRAAFTLCDGENTDANTIFYYNNNNLLSYSNGLYTVNHYQNGNFLKIGAVGDAANTVYFEEIGIDKEPGSYRIEFSDTRRSLYTQRASGNYYTDAAGTNATDAHYRYFLEEVTSLPVTIGSLKFATFCSPVPVTIPDAVTAYAATLSGNTITLYELPTKVIPANCGVLLYADADTYNFAIEGSAEQINNNILTGTVPAIVAPANAYTLQKTSDAETCAFYSKTGTIAGFKSYIVSGSGDSRLSFSIEGDDETGIGSIVNKKANGDGMFLIDGKVVIIKNGVKYNVNGIRY